MEKEIVTITSESCWQLKLHRDAISIRFRVCEIHTGHVTKLRASAMNLHHISKGIAGSGFNFIPCTYLRFRKWECLKFTKKQAVQKIIYFQSSLLYHTVLLSGRYSPISLCYLDFHCWLMYDSCKIDILFDSFKN